MIGISHDLVLVAIAIGGAAIMSNPFNSAAVGAISVFEIAGWFQRHSSVIRGQAV